MAESSPIRFRLCTFGKSLLPSFGIAAGVEDGHNYDGVGFYGINNLIGIFRNGHALCTSNEMRIKLGMFDYFLEAVAKS